MNAYLERLQRKHRLLNSLIDTYRNRFQHHEVKALKRMRLRIKDEIVRLQRSIGTVAP